jgi:hypothetical protein
VDRSNSSTHISCLDYDKESNIDSASSAALCAFTVNTIGGSEWLSPQSLLYSLCPSALSAGARHQGRAVHQASFYLEDIPQDSVLSPNAKMLPSQVFTKLLYSLLLHTEGCAVRRGGEWERVESLVDPTPWTLNVGVTLNSLLPPLRRAVHCKAMREVTMLTARRSVTAAQRRSKWLSLLITVN